VGYGMTAGLCLGARAGRHATAQSDCQDWAATAALRSGWVSHRLEDFADAAGNGGPASRTGGVCILASGLSMKPQMPGPDTPAPDIAGHKTHLCPSGVVRREGSATCANPGRRAVGWRITLKHSCHMRGNPWRRCCWHFCWGFEASVNTGG
jgi:hypothetical protein